MQLVAPLVLLLNSFLVASARSGNAKENDCKYCKFLVETFEKGLRMTENQHFAGGNTDWEERKLGRFKTSETRFLEVMEYACKKNHLEDSSPFDPVKDLQFKCQALAEENEELLESWFFKRQDTQPNLLKFFCIEELRKCCAKDHWGPNCQPCPGAQKTAACFGRGECQGAGTRGGDGKCTCDKGYVGMICSNCDAHYYAVSQNETFIECAECFEGCASGCTAAGPKGCRSCRSGYVMDEQDGCKDVDECEQADRCTKSHEKCVNTAGSYYCNCEDGYRRGESDECEIDVEARPDEGLLPPDVALRYAALAGIVGIASFVLFFHRSPVAIALTVVACIAIVLIEPRESVDKDAKVADGTGQEANDSSTHSPEL